MPDIQLLLTEELAVINNITGKIYLITYADPSYLKACVKAKERLSELIYPSLHIVYNRIICRQFCIPKIYAEFKKEDYLAAVR